MSVNNLTSALASAAVDQVMLAAVKSSISYDDVMDILSNDYASFANFLKVGISSTAMDNCRKEVVKQYLKNLKKSLKKQHGVQLVVAERSAMQGRDWAAYTDKGVIGAIYVAKDIIDNGDLDGYERVTDAITPIFFTKLPSRKFKEIIAADEETTEELQDEADTIKVVEPDPEPVKTPAPINKDVEAVEKIAPTIDPNKVKLAEAVLTSIAGPIIAPAVVKTEDIVETPKEEPVKEEVKPATEETKVVSITPAETPASPATETITLSVGGGRRRRFR